MRHFTTLKALCAATLLTASFSSIAGSPSIPESLIATPPAEHSGLTVFGKQSLKLGDQIPALAGYQVRVRSVTMAPGGIVKNHGHTTRPGAFYVAKGEVIELRGKKKTTVAAGNVILEDHDTEHWVINNTKEDALLFVFDIVPEEK